jgi:tRNA pseudouridine38-40 synthase
LRIKASIAYDGTDFEGFQRQKTTRNTITTAIEDALHSLQIESPITGSGRTDAGVHASGQVIHFDLPPFWSDLDKLKSHLNGRLYSIAFKHLTPVSDNFHARFDAKRRVYRYLFSQQELSVFERQYIARIKPLDLAALEEALRLFEGTHDFGYFMKTGSETRDNIRTIYKARLKKLGKYYAIYFEADGFLRAQVRMMLRAAFDVAADTLTQKQLEEQLTLTHRHTTRLAPPEGLYLARVMY